MPSNSKIETDSTPYEQTKEWIDKTVSATFDELLIEITAKPKFHPTEQHNRDNFLLEHPLSKIYDLINSYHAFCKLCEQHFYSRSLANDVNSFFQKHINTSYHKQMRTLNLPPDNVPMFTWEEQFHSGRCNVCEMSGLNSYVLDTKFDPVKLMKLHFCVWDQENRKNNEKVLRKLNLLKKFCGLTVFRKLFIKRVNEREVCLLCGLNLPWSEEKASCHLVSDHHYQKFCRLLKKFFNFSPKDALNGFNLEMIIRWLISYDPPILKEFVDYDERGVCFENSNNDENPYSDEKDNFSYSPKNVEILLKSEETDFIHKKECLLCNVPFIPGHMNSEQHQIRMMNFDKKSFDSPEKYVVYCRKREKRLHIIENYGNLKLGLKETREPLPSNKNVNHAKQTAFLKMLFVKKLKWVSVKFNAENEDKIFCQVCDQYLFKDQKITHSNSLYHKSQEAKWEQLRLHFANAKFLDPFQKIKKALVCLLCGAVFNTNNFFSHLKGDTHMRKFIWYCNLNNQIPLSSAFVIRADLSCYCTVCNTVFSKGVSFSSLKIALKDIKFHWPCPEIGRKKAESTSESEVINGKEKELIKKNQNVMQDSSITCVTCRRTSDKSEIKTHNVDCSKNIVDFKKVEKTVESIVNIFEKKIINNAFYKSVCLISRLDNSKLIATKEKMKKSLMVEGQPIAHRKTSCGQPLCLCHDRPSASKNERKKEVDEKCEEFVKIESTRKEGKRESTNKGEKEEEFAMKKEKKGEFISKRRKEEEFTRNEEKKKEFTSKEENEIKFTSKEEIEKESISKEENEIESISKEEIEKESISKEENEIEFTSKEENKIESIRKEENKIEFTSKEQNKENEADHEILIIEGLPKCKKKLKAIYSKFSAFGKIRYVLFKGKVAILAFVEPGIAEIVAEGPNIFINEHKLSLRVSTRKNICQAEEKLPLINQDLVNLLQEPQKLMDFILNLIVQAVAALDSPVERRREELVCSTIISSVLECFPHGRCYPFGSRLSGLMLNNSDLDVFLDCGGMYEGFKNTTPVAERNLVRKVAMLLRKKQEITEIIVVDRARVPIVSFLHTPTLTRCDLSFKNGLSVQNTLLIKFILSLDWRVRPLILFLKFWTKVNGLHGPPYFSSYAIAMLVIYYLEQLERPVLPTIEYLQNSYIGRRTTIGGWDCSININTQSLPKSDNKDPLPELLSGLFEFYAEFDYSANIISPLTGKPLPRKAFSYSGFPKLPMCYKRHILNIPTPIENLVNSNILICVMDPFDLSHILTKSFTFQGLQMFIGFCQTSKKHLKKGLLSLN